jgi:hypothetical protein
MPAAGAAPGTAGEARSGLAEVSRCNSFPSRSRSRRSLQGSAGLALLLPALAAGAQVNSLADRLCVRADDRQEKCIGRRFHKRHPTEENARAAKRAFLFLAKRHHPDQGGNHHDFLRLKDAYDRSLAVWRRVAA